MSKRIVPIIAAVIVLGLGVVAFMFLRAPEEASEPIEAVPLATTAAEVETETQTETETETEVETEAAPAAEAEAEATKAPEGETETETEPAPAPTVYEISQADSTVRFELDEDLNGERLTVVGASNQVAGQIAIDLTNLAATQVGVITVNARTLATDNNFRNRAIQNQILDTGAYEFITFTTTSIAGLPDSAVVGETITFTLIGDLTIRDITNEAAFTITAQVNEAGQLVGAASTVVTRGDYDLIIPSVPAVANVEDEVELYIDFVAPPLP